MVCPFCNKSNSKDVETCQCGYKFQDYKLSKTATEEEKKQYKKSVKRTDIKKNLKLLLWVFGIIFGLIFLLNQGETKNKSKANKKKLNASKFIRSVNTLAGTYKQQLGRMEAKFTFFRDYTFLMENNTFDGVARGGSFRINNNKIHLEYYDGGDYWENGIRGPGKQTLIWEAEGKIVYKDNVFLK